MKNLKIMNILLGGLVALGSLASCGGNAEGDDPTRDTGISNEGATGITRTTAN